MTAFDAAAGRNDPPAGQHTLGHAAGGLVSKRIVTGYGFWIFLLSDIIMFSAFFAAYAVLVGDTTGARAGGSFSTCATSGLRRRFFSFRASPSASQASVPERRADPGSMARWPRPLSLEPRF
jgi:heme/copper-type cytochrome/quinol oxidase subunit 3